MDMVEVKFKLYDMRKTKELTEKLTLRGCKIKSLSISESSREPVELTAVCHETVVDEIVREIENPNIIEKILPDKLAPYPEWEIRKTRKIF